MKSYTVHKGVEAPLKIWGMTQKYFYFYSGIGAVIIAMTIGLVMASVRGEFRLGRIFLIVTIAFSLLIGLRLFFIMRSGKRGYKDNLFVKTLSNSDITKLKRKKL